MRKSLQSTFHLFIILRLLLPLVIFIHPLAGILVSIFIDGIDYRILVRKLKLRQLTYELYDKALDFYWYTLIVIYSLLYSIPTFIQVIIIFFFVIRLVGEIIFSVSHIEPLLFFFPNLIEPLFWVWILVPHWFTDTRSLSIIIGIILPCKLIQEYILHVKRFDLIDHLNFWPIKQINYYFSKNYKYR